MLKHLPPKGLDSLLVFYNKIWQQGYFPEKWLESTIIPISKPGKHPTNSSNYRPISLAGVLCKVMERIVNVRLLNFLDQKGALSTLQCGGWAKRTTVDHLLSQEATVRKTQANSAQVVSILFDMEKAYKVTWRHGIRMDIHEDGIEGRMLEIIQNFLKPRSFKVKATKILSDTEVQTEGIPQGSVVRPTFFILKIKEKCSKIAEWQQIPNITLHGWSPDILPPSRWEGCSENAPGQ